MATPIPIEDARDDRLADYRHMKDAGLGRSTDDRPGVFIAEGVNVIRRLLTSAFPVRSVLVPPRRFELLEPALTSTDAPIYVASREVMKRVASSFSRT